MSMRLLQLHLARISAINLTSRASSPLGAGGRGAFGEYSMRISIVAAAAGALFLSACSGGSGIVTGAIPGANTGRVVGSAVASGEGEPAVGPVEGGLMGAEVGRSLSDADRKIALKAEYEALEYGRAGQPTEWRSRSGEVSGKIEVGSVSQVNSLDCREYTHNISFGGRMRVVKGTACREPNGTWRIVG